MGGWVGRHKYNDGEFEGLTVFTNRFYYRGAIGVILNQDEEIATKKPLVQIKGAKTGRRWPLWGSGKFFEVSVDENSLPIQTAWALRYGGGSAGLYTFEIINQPESTVVEVLQTIQIPEASFLKGFTVKGIFIKGLLPDEYGVIEFELLDLTLSKGSSQ